MIQRPTTIGLTICEQVIVEETTRNVSLINCFSRLRVPRLPNVAPNFAVYAVLTDGIGAGRLRLVVERLDTLEVIYERHQPITFATPLQEVRVLFRSRRVSFPAEGRYQISLLVDNELVAHRVVDVLQETPP